MRFYNFIGSVAKFILLTTGFAVPFFLFPQVRSIFEDLTKYYLGDIPSVVWTLSEPEIKKSYEFGYKLFTLLGGWFALLFVFELLLRVILGTIGFVIRKVLGRSAVTTKSEDINNQANAVN